MKPFINCLTIILLACIMLSCSEKEISSSGNSLRATKIQSIKRGEPVIFTFTADSSGKKLEWSVTPAAKAQISTAYNKAQIKFNVAGNFTVTATNGTVSERTMISVDTTTYISSDSTVSDTIIIVPVDTVKTDTVIHVPSDTVKTDTITKPKPVNPDSLEKVTPLINEELILTPYLVDSLPTPGLGIRAVTAGNYKCYYSYIITSSRTSNGILEILYPGVHEYLNCTAGAYKPTGYTFFPKVKIGVTALEIEVNGKKYTGTVTASGSSFTIDWPYTSGVRFTTLTVKK
jgi:hypothetical protein